MEEYRQQVAGHLNIINSNGFIGTSQSLNVRCAPDFPVPSQALLGPRRPGLHPGKWTWPCSFPAPVATAQRLDWHVTGVLAHGLTASPKEMINSLGHAHQYLWTDQLEFSLKPY